MKEVEEEKLVKEYEKLERKQEEMDEKEKWRERTREEYILKWRAVNGDEDNIK